MNKEFTAVYPDEPYKVTTKLNNTIKCVYQGRRYVLVRVNEADGTVFCVDRQSDSAEEIETFKVEEQGHFSVVLDAEVHTFEAAYLTNLYEHDDVPNYKETLPNGETYEYNYGNDGSILHQPCYANDMKYDRNTNSWIRPRFRVHALSREQFFSSVANQHQYFASEAVDTSKYTNQQLAKLKDYADYLATVPTVYATVDHWKIPSRPVPQI
jgi:hypothetical protein